MSDRARRAAELLAADHHAASIGIRLVDVTDEGVSVALTIDERHTNFLGVGHGGVVFSVADCAFSLASNLPGPVALAIDAHLALTAAARPGDILTARAEEVRRGTSLATYRVTVTRQDGLVAAAFTGTVSLRRGV